MLSTVYTKEPVPKHSHRIMLGDGCGLESLCKARLVVMVEFNLLWILGHANLQRSPQHCSYPSGNACHILHS